MLHEHLRDAWSVRKRAVPIIPALHFSPDGLALGAGTIPLPAEAPRRLAKLDGQINAAGPRPIRWYFAEEQAANYVRFLLKAFDEGRGAIDVQYRPPLRVISGRAK